MTSTAAAWSPLPDPSLLPGPTAAEVWEASLDLPLQVEASALARRALRDWLTGWAVDDLDLVEDALLVVSELVANAVRHGGERVRLEAALAGPLLALAVSDGSAVLPRPQAVGEDEEGGRGLAIVDALAQDWGVEEAHGGKRVWVHLPVV